METTHESLWTVDINDGQRKLSVKNGLSLLAGLGRNDIVLPAACGGNARCGYCKVKLLKGAGPVTVKEEPLLSAEEKADGVRLSCQVPVQSDLSISLPPHILSVKRFTGRLIGKQMLTYDIVRLRIELIRPDALDFTAGQFVQIRSQPYSGKEVVLRNFSIASSPSDRNHVDLMVRRVPAGICTTWIFDHLKEGETVYFSAPYGDFKLSNASAPVLFIAGGSGMAPVWSILNDMKEKGSNRTAWYFFGALTQRDLFLTDELFRLQKELPEFSFVPALSNEPAESGWKGERGLITDVVSRHFPNCSEFEAYMCGSPGMIDACIKVLVKGGMAEHNIFYDKFV
ncbi:MAG: 2Fe-2S iron-sulfur cluster binding domain-containing protein [Chitinivibrionales bacterium]